jgi:hypothetical protein
MSSQKLTPAQIRQKRLAALSKRTSSAVPTTEDETKTSPPSTLVNVVAAHSNHSPGAGNGASLSQHWKEEAIRQARGKHKDFDNKDLEAKKQIVRELYKQLKNQNTKPKAKVVSKTAKKKKKEKRVHWQNGQSNGPLATNQQQKTNQMHAVQLAKEEQERQNAIYAIKQQQGEFQHLDEWENEQKAIELQERYNREHAQAIANAANAENQQPRLGCRPDSTNAACIGSGAAMGAAVGSVVPVLGTGVGACVGTACALGAAVRRRFTGQGRKSRKKRGRKHKRRTRKHHKKRHTKRRKKNRKKNRKKRTKRRR